MSRKGHEAPPIEEQEHLWFQIYPYAESFYYFAHRISDILRKDNRCNLPYVTGFVPCEQIIRIRNDLIEHAYLKPKLLESGGAKAVLNLNYGPIIQRRDVGGGAGPEPEPDRGMFVNARALREAVHPVLKRALDAVGGRIPDPESARTNGGQTAEDLS